MRVDWSAQEIQETLLPEADLRSYFLREKAALWWISNQSDDLLGLPYCRIARLEYQVRTALRVIGPMRGRALLSDEVGLGKTIEAGLVLKEYLTRGMVKQMLLQAARLNQVVNRDGMRLADPVQSSNALLDFHRIPRQVEIQQPINQRAGRVLRRRVARARSGLRTRLARPHPRHRGGDRSQIVERQT